MPRAPASTSSPTVAEAIATARNTPLARGRIADLAAKIPANVAARAASEALEGAGVHAAMVLAFAAAVAGGRLPPDLTRALLPEVSSLDHVGALAFATSGDPLDVLVGFLEDARGDLELECLVLLLAADALGKREPPRGMLVRGRWLARHRLPQEGSVFLGGAVARIGNAELSSLAAPHVNRARRSKKVIEEALEIARTAPLDVLADVDGARLSTGFTVRHATPNVGRNDPCPCGSGKKYKKCHGGEQATPTPEPTAAPRIDAAAIGPDQAALLRPSEIAALETTKLSPKAFVEAFRRVVDFRSFPLALRMIEEARARRDLPEETDASLVLDALHAAYDARSADAAQKLTALLPADLAERESFALECLRGPADMLARIEAEAEEALRRDADGARGMLLATALLRWYPALGVYVARGALHEARTEDSRALLEQIEDARDRLLLSPFEAWWDVYEAFFENPEDRREQAREDAKREKMKEDLRRARAASRKTAAELEKLQQRVVELDHSLAAAPPPTRGKTEVAAPPVSADLVEERKRLKTKIDELQRIIGEGQEERRDLRRQLAEREEEPDDEPESPRTRRLKDDDDDDSESSVEGGGVDVPRAILVPQYSDRAAKAVTDLAADAADGVLGVVAALAAGRPNAWGGVKQLTKARGVLSARAGIHHRVLFAVADQTLTVLEVLHRRDLEQAVTRLARTRDGA